jgi:hypothetical protein
MQEQLILKSGTVAKGRQAIKKPSKTNIAMI